MTSADFQLAQDRFFQRCGVRAESRFVDVPSISGRAHVIVAGEGPPVVMVIGGGGLAAMWAPLMAELAGFRLYAIDRPGFGLTETVAHTTSGIRSMAVRFLEQVLDGLGLGTPQFVTNSMGSTWSIWLALDRPSRVPSMVQIGCSAWILDTSAPFPIRLLSIPPVGRVMMRMQPPSPGQAEKLFRMMGEDISEMPEFRDLFVVGEQLPDYGPTWLDLLHAGLRLRGVRPEVSLAADQLGRLSQPVQLIWGRSDPFGSPEVGMEVARCIPNSELHLVEGGHTPWLSRARAVAELARPFLHQHSASPTATTVPTKKDG